MKIFDWTSHFLATLILFSKQAMKMYFDIFFHLYCLLWVYVYIVSNLIMNFYFPNLLDDLNNLEEYISLVVDATVKTGITRQLEAFRVAFY